MSDDVRAAYDAPFPDEASKAGPRAMPTLVPTRPDDPASEANRAAWEVLSDVGQAVPGRLQRQRPDHRRDGADPAQARPRHRGLDHPTIAGAGHFLQEDAGTELGRVVRDFMVD